MTLPEIFVSMGIFAVLSIVLFAAAQVGVRSYTAVEGRYGASTAIRKATLALQRDTKHSDGGQMQTALLGDGHGDILWFLSAEDPDRNSATEERFLTNDTAQPQWRRNIIYYLVRPAEHDSVSNGYSCTSVGAGTSDTICPHKFLIRLVVNGPDDATGEELLLSESDARTYAKQPTGYDFASLQSASEVEDVKLVTNNMLQFQVNAFTSGDRLLDIGLAATRLDEARKTVASFGSVSLLAFPVTTAVNLILAVENEE